MRPAPAPARRYSTDAEGRPGVPSPGPPPAGADGTILAEFDGVWVAASDGARSRLPDTAVAGAAANRGSLRFEEVPGDVIEAAASMARAGGANIFLFHCIADDLTEGAGIAADIRAIAGQVVDRDRRPPGAGWRPRVLWQRPPPSSKLAGVTIGNLVTKRRHDHRPARKAIAEALREAAEGLPPNATVFMPHIACGLDGFHWDTPDGGIRGLVRETFARFAPHAAVWALSLPSDDGGMGRERCDRVGDLGFLPSVPPAEWAERVSAARPGCDVADCAICRAWASAVEECRPIGDVTRKGALDAAVRMVLLARERGFATHTPFVSADKCEEGSVDSAPDTPELKEALARADEELKAHARPVGPSVTSDPAYTARRILADAQGLYQARAAAGRMLPSSVRAIEAMPESDWWEVAAGLLQDLSSASLRLFIPRPGATPPVAAFPFVVHQHGKARLCINFRPFNGVFRESSYRLPRPRDLALAGVGRRWLVKLDLRQAFRRVKVPAAVEGVLGCAAGGSLFIYDNLPFGWCFAPEVFSATLAPVIDRVRGALAGRAVLVAYVDDIAIAADTPEEAVRAATTALEILREGGFVASCKKSFLRPVRTLKFLGVAVTAGPNPAVAVTREMTERVIGLASDPRATIRSGERLAELWGLVSFAAYTVRPRLAVYRAALDPAASAAIDGRTPWAGDPSAEAALEALVVKAARAFVLAWAEGPHELFRGLARPRAALTSDASSSGGAARLAVRGVVLRQRWAWTLPEAATPSAGRELLVAARSLLSWGPSIAGHTVDWMCDASAATSAMSSWSSASAASAAALEAIEEASRKYDIEVVPWWYARTTPEIREVDADSRAQRLKVPVAGVASVAFGAEAVARCSAACGIPGVTLHHMWVPGSEMVAGAYTAPLPNGGVRGAGAGGTWRGPPSPASWTGNMVWAPVSRANRADVALWLREASQRGPCAVLVPMPTSGGGAAAGGTDVLDHTTVCSAPLLRKGERLLQWDIAAARWAPRAAERDWEVRVVFASPDAPVDRSMSREERLRALHASGFPPHPGPPPRKRRVGGAAAAATLDAAIHDGAAEGGRPTEAVWWGAGQPPGVAAAIDRACDAPSSTLTVAAAMRAAAPGGVMATGGAVPPPAADGRPWPSVREVLSALAVAELDDTIALAARCGWLTPTLQTNAAVRAQLAAALVEVDSVVGPSTEARAARVACQLQAVAAVAEMADEPYSTQALDALAVAWVRTRLRLPGALAVQFDPTRGGTRRANAPAVAADAGALAARLRRRIGSWRAEMVPPVCLGPLSQALLLARGSAARHDSSPKRVVWGWELQWGLQRNPHVAALHPEACAALLAMGGSMWRSIYIRNLRRCDAMWFGAPAGPAPPPGVPVSPFASTADTAAFARHAAAAAAGAAAPPEARRCVAFRWSGAHKTNRWAADTSLPSTPRFGFVAAPWVLAVVGPFIPTVHDPSDVRPLFPDPTSPGARPMSYGYLSSVLSALLSGLPGADQATLHGLRLGCDAELRALGVADEIRDALGWWRRLVRRMSEHYEALDAARLAAAVSLYGTLLAQALAPGLMATSAHFRGQAPGTLAWFRDAVSRSSTVAFAGVPSTRLMPDGADTGAAAPSGVQPGRSGDASTGPASAVATGGRGGGAAAAARSGAAGGAGAADSRLGSANCVCHACGIRGHTARNRMCPALRARPEARLVSEPGDDQSESDSDDDETVAMAARRPPPPPRGLPRPIVDGAVGSELLRVATRAAAARAVQAAARDAARGPAPVPTVAVARSGGAGAGSGGAGAGAGGSGAGGSRGAAAGGGGAAGSSGAAAGVGAAGSSCGGSGSSGGSGGGGDTGSGIGGPGSGGSGPLERPP